MHNGLYSLLAVTFSENERTFLSRETGWIMARGIGQFAFLILLATRSLNGVSYAYHCFKKEEPALITTCFFCCEKSGREVKEQNLRGSKRAS